MTKNFDPRHAFLSNFYLDHYYIMRNGFKLLKPSLFYEKLAQIAVYFNWLAPR